MKKAFLLVLALLFSASWAVAAPDRSGKWDAGLNVSASIPDDSDVDSAAYVGGTVSYGITPTIAVGVESGWESFDIEDSLRVLGFSDWGNLNGVPLLADIIIRGQSADQPFVPYGVVGLGAIFWDFDESSQLEATTTNLDLDTAFAAKFGAGVDWFINDNWALNFEASYVTSDADVTVTSGGVSASVNGVDTDYWMVGGGVKYLFS